MSHYHLRVYQAGKLTPHTQLDRLVESIRTCDLIFMYIDDLRLENFLFEAGVAAAFHKKLYIYLDQGIAAQFESTFPLHQYGAKEVLVSRSLDEACADFSRLLGRKFNYRSPRGNGF